MYDLSGRICLITGCSAGLGAHFARVLAQAGAKVVAGARRKERIEALADEIRAAGHRAAIRRTRHREDDVRLHQRAQVERVAALRRVERVLVGVELRDQRDDFRLVGRFEGDLYSGHGGLQQLWCVVIQSRAMKSSITRLTGSGSVTGPMWPRASKRCVVTRGNAGASHCATPCAEAVERPPSM